MILQIGPALLAAQAVEIGGQLANLATGRRLGIFPEVGGVAAFTPIGFLQASFARLFRRRTPRLSRQGRTEVVRAMQIANITGDPLVRVADPFRTQTLGIFRESQAPIAPLLFREAALRREAARAPVVSRAPQMPFTPERVARIQEFFGSLPTLDPGQTLQERKTAIAAIAAASPTRRSRLAAGIRLRDTR